ncbi:MAG: hydantoinase/oxoprolinase family protein [Alphaproteobacteria bacterium]
MAEGDTTPGRIIGVDTGGTFTDLVCIDGEGRLHIEKAFSTPARPEDAIGAVLEQLAAHESTSLAALLEATIRFAHGTTVSTNALIERKGARVGLLTTAGFEDTLQIARGPIGRAGGLPQSLAMDFIHTEPLEPLAPKRRIRGLSERITVDGDILMSLDSDEVRQALGELLDEGIDSLAVCLLWSFRNPAHERMVAEVAAELAPDLPVSLSSDIAPRIGEFERSATTVVNAYVGPVSARYITALQDDLAARGLARPVQVMQASGGLTLPDRIAHQAVSVINSGPVGGLVAARHFGAALGHDDVITADMGGTSFDVGLIANGRFEEQTTPFLDQGLPVLSPALKIVTIGAGGGSIAWTDGYRLQVGPGSAGAEPGPACYGRGGDRPTVTDALVTLGIIDPQNFFGGRFCLDSDLAQKAIHDHVAKPLGLDVMEAAAGIYDVVTAKMADLIRKVTVESGNDPRRFCLFAYGGGSGAHCAAFSAQLGIGRVIIPYAAPVFSALGIALSDVIYSHAKSDPVALDESGGAAAAINGCFAELAEKALADMAASGIEPDEIVLRHRIDMRYQGQMNEISLPWEKGRMEPGDIPALQQAFEDFYRQRFGAGTIRKETPLEIISYRVEALKINPPPPQARLFDPADEARPTGERRVYRRGEGWLSAAIFPLDRIGAGAAIHGPAIIESDSTTVWLPPAAAAELDEFGNLDIRPGR